MLKEMIIPAAAIRDDNSVEMLRVWIAEQGLHCAINVGMYDGLGLDEEQAWGVILADVARHLANAREESGATSAASCLEKIRASMAAELDAPTSEAVGEFPRPN